MHFHQQQSAANSSSRLDMINDASNKSLYYTKPTNQTPLPGLSRQAGHPLKCCAKRGEEGRNTHRLIADRRRKLKIRQRCHPLRMLPLEVVVVAVAAAAAVDVAGAAVAALEVEVLQVPAVSTAQPFQE